MSTPFELTFMPYLAMSEGEELRLGRVTVRNWKDVLSHISDDRLAERIRQILSMYRQRGNRAGRTTPLNDIAVLTVGGDATHELSKAELDDVMEMRYALFLCCLARSARSSRRNAGSFTYTSENFDVVRQKFVFETDRISEVAGSVIQITNIGYRLGESEFLVPSHVNRPSRLQCDAHLYRELAALRNRNRKLFRRVIRATSIFIASDYNTHAVSVEARILLAAAAFEILLDLPDQGQRKAFKDRVETLLAKGSERRYSYKYEVRGARRRETRSTMGIWADRFYTLRNHIIHGAKIPTHEFEFRGQQHHYIIARMVFTSLVERLIDEWRVEQGLGRVFFNRPKWTTSPASADDKDRGFRIDMDFGAMIEAGLPSSLFDDTGG